MKNQQQVEREEQQRIKSLVLNYDLQQNDDQERKEPQPKPESIALKPQQQSTTIAQRHSITTASRDRRIAGKEFADCS